MKAIIQRVTAAYVVADGQLAGEIGKGLFILLGVVHEDTQTDVEKLVGKITRMRIFPDQQGKNNLSVSEVDGEALVVSNFTLAANCRKGNRPDYTEAAPPDQANQLYESFIAGLREVLVGRVECGVFGASMEISAQCHGPVTIVLDSREL